MKKNVIVFGLISGLIVSVLMVIGMAWCYKSGNHDGNMILGYASMLLAFSLIFVGVKNYRDKYNNGVISFGKAFKIGLYISLIASTMYVLAWLIDYYLFMPDFMDKYAAHEMAKAQSSGASAADIAAKVKEISYMKRMYSSFIWVVLFTYMEILPVGLIVSLITAFILKRKAKSGNVAVA
ncbi:DUF4199 domain-containing protein [Mucilaginibacter sp.]|uniref:DUF4199 domain-containing protein n=1 Tax=Mucilaginibacter sp. TaxID=1882438 RepID=UPI0026045ACF|nr:DUF4199 domain-containing protein [Mucilaginibacter sp.]MDB5126253.1 hypothetical protein [Mucilaginibacter sp.]